MEHLTSVMLGWSAVAAALLAQAVLAGTALWIVAALCLRLVPGVRPSNRFAVWAFALAAAVGFYLLPLLRQSAMTTSGGAGALRLDPRWAVPVAVAWALMSIARVVKVLRGGFEVYGIGRRSQPVKDSRFAALLAKGAGARTVLLCTSDEVDRPCVVGLLRPRILVPGLIYEELADGELEQILVHELGHVRRYDDWTNLLQKICLALFPLNPALAWIERSLCVERELACDDCVLSTTTQRRQYALCLANLAEYAILRRNLELTLGAWGRQPELTRRVMRILHQPASRLGRRAGYALTAIIMLALAAGGAKLATAPAVIHFTQAEASVAAVAGSSMNAEAAARTMTVSGAQAVMVKAVMPAEGGRSREATLPLRRHANGVKCVVKKRPVRPANPALLVRTEFDEFALPRLVLTLEERSTPTRAIFLPAQGWLVIQL